MTGRHYRLILLCADGAEKYELLQRAEFERRAVSDLLPGWLGAAPGSLGGGALIWNGSAHAFYCDEKAEANGAAINERATAAFRAMLAQHPREVSTDTLYGRVLIVQDQGTRSKSSPPRSTDELAAHDWFGLRGT